MLWSKNQGKQQTKTRILQNYRFILLLALPIIISSWGLLPLLSEQPVIIKVLMGALDAANIEPYVQEFNAKNPDIHLQIVEGPNATNLIEDLYTSSFLLGNSPYDLVFMDIIWVPKFAAAGWLLPLSERIGPASRAEFLRGDIEGGIYQEELYRIPFRSDAGMLYYRQDLLDAAGFDPPQTFSDLLQISQELQQQGLVEWGYLWQGRQYEGLAAMFVEILRGYGGFWVNPDTLEVGLDLPEAIAAVNFLLTTINLGVSPPSVVTYQEEETRFLFQNGLAAFLRSWPYVFSLASQENSAIRGKFGIIPMVHAPSKMSGACQGGWGFGIAKTSKHPDAAWRFIEFITSEAIQRQFILKTGYVPTRKSLFTDPAILAQFSHYPQLLEVIENSTLRPTLAQYSQASDILQRYLSAALSQAKTPTETMEAAAAETRRLLATVKP